MSNSVWEIYFIQHAVEIKQKNTSTYYLKTMISCAAVAIKTTKCSLFFYGNKTVLSISKIVIILLRNVCPVFTDSNHKEHRKGTGLDFK